MLRCVCLIESLLTLTKSDSHNQVARCGKHFGFDTCSWPICQLCLRHISDDLLREVGCKWVSGLFLRNVLCWCRSVSTSIVSPCSTNSSTSWSRQALSQLQEVALQRITEKQVMPFESYLASFVLYSFAHRLDRIFLRVGSTDLPVSTQIRSNGFLPASLHSCVVGMVWTSHHASFSSLLRFCLQYRWFRSRCRGCRRGLLRIGGSHVLGQDKGDEGGPQVITCSRQLSAMLDAVIFHRTQLAARTIEVCHNKKRKDERLEDERG